RTLESPRGLTASLVCTDGCEPPATDTMPESDLDSTDELAQHILDTSREATREAIRKLPRGRFKTSMMLDGYEAPIELHASLEIGDGEITVDYAGSSPASGRGINSPRCYTEAYSVFGLKCII